MSADQTDPKQRLWNDILDDQRRYPEEPHDLRIWENFIETGVTAYDGDSTCIWRDGREVFLDGEVPYVTEPHPDFPFMYSEDTELIDENVIYLAWEPSEPTPVHHPEESETQLDKIVRLTTASSSMKELVEAMRGSDGYGQKYTPTLRPEAYGSFGRPDLEEGLHEVRAEIQRLGFKVYPEDEFYTQRVPEPEAFEPGD